MPCVRRARSSKVIAKTIAIDIESQRRRPLCGNIGLAKVVFLFMSTMYHMLYMLRWSFICWPIRDAAAPAFLNAGWVTSLAIIPPPISAGSIPNNLGIKINWELIQNWFLMVKNQFFSIILGPKMAKQNQFSIPRVRNRPNPSRDQEITSLITNDHPSFLPHMPRHAMSQIF